MRCTTERGRGPPGTALEAGGEPLREGQARLAEQVTAPGPGAPGSDPVVELDPEAPQDEAPDVAALAQHVRLERRDEGAGVLPGPPLLPVEPLVRLAPGRDAGPHPRVGIPAVPTAAHARILQPRTDGPRHELCDPYARRSGSRRTTPTRAPGRKAGGGRMREETAARKVRPRYRAGGYAASPGVKAGDSSVSAGPRRSGTARRSRPGLAGGAQGGHRDDALPSAEEAAGYFGAKTTTVCRRCEEGRLPCPKVGSPWRGEPLGALSDGADGPGVPRSSRVGARSPDGPTSENPSLLGTYGE